AAATDLNGIIGLVPIKKRAHAGSEEFEAQDAEDAKMEEKLAADLKQGKVDGGERMIRSCVAGFLSGLDLSLSVWPLVWSVSSVDILTPFNESTFSL
ncbi:hypothetical protein FRC12_022508, partial [Ceratobasidium sp. 428]